MDGGTAHAERRRLNPYGGASRRERVFASEPERKRVTHKSLKGLGPRKRKACILVPPALNFLPYDLDFPSKEFENASTDFC